MQYRVLRERRILFLQLEIRKKKSEGKKGSKIKWQREMRKERYSIINILNVNNSKVKASTFKAKSLALLTSFSSGVLGHSNAKWGKKNILKIEDNSFYCVGMGNLE